MALQSAHSSAHPGPRLAGRLAIGRGHWLALVYLGLSIIALIPVFAVDLPPLVDLPNHLARVHVLASISETAALQDNYAVAWGLLPNLAMDLLLVPMTWILPALDAGRLFLAATLLLMLGGTLALHRAVHGRIGLWPAAVFLFLYNYLLLWGFLNYLFTIGLFLCAFAGWIASERWPGPRRLALFSAISLILYFGHLLAFAVYGVCVGAYELWRLRESETALSGSELLGRALRFIPFVPPLALWLAFPVGNEAAFTHFGTLGHKAVAILSPTLFSLDPIDLATFGFACLVLLYGLLTKSVTLAPALRVPIIFLGTVAVLMPNWLFGVWGADLRLPTVLVCLAIAGIRVHSWNPKAAGIVAAAALFLFAARVWTVTESWTRFDRQAAEFQAAARMIEEGARVLTVQAPPAGDARGARGLSDPIAWLLRVHEIGDSRDPDGRRLFYPAYWHLPALAVIERSVFLPTMFTGPQQPLRAAAANQAIDTSSSQPITLGDLDAGADPERAARLARMTDRQGRGAYWADWPRHFDYVLILDFGAARNPQPELLSILRAGSFFTLYAVANSPLGPAPGAE
jgi:hypothetical protein